MTPEGRVKKMVKKALDMLGEDCWRFMPVQTGFGSPALDYLLCIRQRFVAIETKAPGKKLTPLQEGTKAAIEAAGGIVLVVWDEDSLAIAMKIIFALEFAPDAERPSLRHCLEATGAKVPAVPGNAQTARRHAEHMRVLHARNAPNTPVGWDHGAPRAQSKRRA